MKIFAIGDPHFKKGNLHFMKWACQEILEIARREEPDLCICLGDTLDTNNRIEMRAQRDAINFFFQLAEICPLIILIGNHDRENKTDFLSDVHPFFGLKKTPNITVVDSTIWDTQRNFIYVPYVAPGRFREALEKVDYYPDDTDPEDQPRLIFAHQEIRGSFYGSKKNSVSEDGDVWNSKYPLIISGHIHEYQVLPGVVYVGTFYQQNYGENANKALMMIYLDEEAKPESFQDKDWVIFSTDAPNTITLPKLPTLITDGTLELIKPEVKPEVINPELIKPNLPVSSYSPKRVRIQRIPLKSLCTRKTIRLDLSTLPNFAQLLPTDNIRSEEVNQSEQKKVGTLVRVEIIVDATEKKMLKTNPCFLALEKIVDQIDIITTGDKANLALTIRDQVLQENKEARAKEPQNGKPEQTLSRDVSLVDVVKKLLADDPVVYQMFMQEIASN